MSGRYLGEVEALVLGAASILLKGNCALESVLLALALATGRAAAAAWGNDDILKAKARSLMVGSQASCTAVHFANTCLVLANCIS